MKPVLFGIYLLLIAAVGSPCLATLSLPPCPHAKILEDNIPRNNPRFSTFQYALQLMTQRKAHVIVETGTARYGKSNFIGDGGSTYIFGEWASENNAILYSVDIDENALRRAANDLDLTSKPYVHFIPSDSIKFLNEFNQTIDFLYLDSYDFEINNPLPSQLHHLNEIIATYPKLTAHSVVMIDDCNLPYGGKGKLVVDYLLKRGWKIVMQDYQILLTKQ